jgi:hypothetical protein
LRLEAHFGMTTAHRAIVEYDFQGAQAPGPHNGLGLPDLTLDIITNAAETDQLLHGESSRGLHLVLGRLLTLDFSMIFLGMHDRKIPHSDYSAEAIRSHNPFDPDNPYHILVVS